MGVPSFVPRKIQSQVGTRKKHNRIIMKTQLAHQDMLKSGVEYRPGMRVQRNNLMQAEPNEFDVPSVNAMIGNQQLFT